MSSKLTDETDHEARLNEVLLTYLEELEAGQSPDIDQLVQKYPDLRDELQEFVSSRLEIDRLAAPLRAANGTQNSTHERTESPSRGAVGSTVVHEHGDSEIGQLGDFRILREIGRGGMGVVYEAQQISLRRRVALKVLPFASAIDSRQLQRFKNEALAAAHLQHASIVPVHAVGCVRGVHYYAMQFIDGMSLSELIAELRKETEQVQSEVTVSRTQLVEGVQSESHTAARTRSTGQLGHCEWVARVGRQAALALEHAHQTGIVHRDIKPSNLLLDPQGQIWVTDFGLAQVAGDGNLTATGELLGTLRYSSPEQAMARRGIVDHRSDIYSLGATLYELLTLRPVFEGKDRGELLRQIAEVEPVLPRVLKPAIPEDLETVLLKALRKEPSERYSTAEELASDLQRFIEHRPVFARRPTFLERARKWGRRHPAMIATVMMGLLILSAGSMAGAALLRLEQGRTKAAQREAEAAYERERLRAEEAEAQYRLARRSVDELIQVSEEELAHRQGMEGLRKRLLTSALAYYQEFSRQRRDDVRARVELADTTRRVEGILADLAALRSASQMYLLLQNDVLDDLQLVDPQRSEVKQLAARAGKQWMSSFHEFRQLSPAERGRRILVRARATEAEVNRALSVSQQARLRQIAMQVDGVAAFRNQEVVTALQLTSVQREQIRKIEEEAHLERTRGPISSTSTENSVNAVSTRMKAQVERVMAVLTLPQKQQWKSLVGETFQGHVPTFGHFSRPAPAPRR